MNQETREERHARRRAERLQTCAHFNGMGLYGQPDKKCEAGVCYKTLQGDDKDDQGRYIDRLPCLPPLSPFQATLPRIYCKHFRAKTAEEVDAEEAAMAARMKLHAKVGPAVIAWRQKPPKGKREVIECPACGGRLHLSQSSYNGHVHGRCETVGCVSWME